MGITRKWVNQQIPLYVPPHCLEETMWEKWSYHIFFWLFWCRGWQSMEDNATRGGWFIQSLGSICAQKGKALCLYTERFFMVPQAVHTHAKIMNLLLERYLKIKKQESALVRFSLDLVLAETEKISKESPLSQRSTNQKSPYRAHRYSEETFEWWSCMATAPHTHKGWSEEATSSSTLIYFIDVWETFGVLEAEWLQSRMTWPLLWLWLD